jgi:hypothetical protein
MVDQSELTESELAFLRHYGYGPEDVHDARYLPKNYWPKDKDIVLGSKCRQARHRLRTRAGHCVQCDPKKLGFLQRFSATQYVYIAGSKDLRLIKVGTSSNIDQRERQMRTERYGGAGDWQVLLLLTVANAGSIENRIQYRLSQYCTTREYWKDGWKQVAVELFKCPFSKVRQTLLDVVGPDGLGAWVSKRTGAYEFEDAAR